MKIKRNSIAITLTLLSITLFILVATKLDMHNENYSTLSLTTKGYFLFLFMGLIAGFTLAYETRFIANKKCALLVFLALLIGTIIPHDISYGIQGNLHLFNAYLGFFILVFASLINIYYFRLSSKRISNIVLYIYLLCIVCAIYLYLDKLFVSTLCELIVIISTLLMDLFLLLNLK